MWRWILPQGSMLILNSYSGSKMLGLQVTIRDQKFESADQNFAAANQILG